MILGSIVPAHRCDILRSSGVKGIWVIFKVNQGDSIQCIIHTPIFHKHFVIFIKNYFKKRKDFYFVNWCYVFQRKYFYNL